MASIFINKDFTNKSSEVDKKYYKIYNTYLELI